MVNKIVKEKVVKEVVGFKVELTLSPDQYTVLVDLLSHHSFEANCHQTNSFLDERHDEYGEEIDESDYCSEEDFKRARDKDDMVKDILTQLR